MLSCAACSVDVVQVVWQSLLCSAQTSVRPFADPDAQSYVGKSMLKCIVGDTRGYYGAALFVLALFVMAYASAVGPHPVHNSF